MKLSTPAALTDCKVWSRTSPLHRRRSNL